MSNQCECEIWVKDGEQWDIVGTSRTCEKCGAEWHYDSAHLYSWSSDNQPRPILPVLRVGSHTTVTIRIPRGQVANVGLITDHRPDDDYTKRSYSETRRDRHTDHADMGRSEWAFTEAERSYAR